jgi:hypothetical protein
MKIDQKNTVVRFRHSPERAVTLEDEGFHDFTIFRFSLFTPSRLTSIESAGLASEPSRTEPLRPALLPRVTSIIDRQRYVLLLRSGAMASLQSAVAAHTSHTRTSPQHETKASLPATKQHTLIPRITTHTLKFSKHDGEQIIPAHVRN